MRGAVWSGRCWMVLAQQVGGFADKRVQSQPASQPDHCRHWCHSITVGTHPRANPHSHNQVVGELALLAGRQRWEPGLGDDNLDDGLHKELHLA